jgi:transposase
VELIESRYGQADRIWAMDRGMVSQDNVKFLQEGKRRYILGTPRSLLRRYERQLQEKDWTQVHEGLEVKLAPAPEGQEVFILCRSQARQAKEQAMHQRFGERIEKELKKIAASCHQRPQEPTAVAQRVGRLLGRNTRAAGAFQTRIATDEQGHAQLIWSRDPAWQEWASLSEGCYLLRSNILDWSPQELWKAYMQLTEAEGAFRIHKSDLSLRPIWHQKQERVEAHILVCFLAYVLWKTLARCCEQAGLGQEPRKVLEEIKRIKAVDLLLPTHEGPVIRRACVSRPEEHQAILLHHLGLSLPSWLAETECSEDF